MKTEQRIWMKKSGWAPVTPGPLGKQAQLVFVFGARQVLKDGKTFQKIKEDYPGACIFGCSTAGEIIGAKVLDNSIVTTAVKFEHTKLHGLQIKLNEMDDSYQAGRNLAETIPKEGLVHLFVLSDGVKVNGSALADGLTSHLPGHVAVTGGLAGDGSNFEETIAFWDSVPQKDTIAVLGLYGDRLKVGYGSMGGWDPFGTDRLITRSSGNVLYEMDGRSALDLYKIYLGEHAQGLPATGLLFPLSIRTKERDTRVVRTILSVNEKEQSMTFAGDVPEGTYARLMKANFDRLIDGATGAARNSLSDAGAVSPELAILISCVGRKLVLKQRIEEEVEGVQEVLGPGTVLTGFYSYGEICPFASGEKSELHNQTMTVTTFREE